MEIIFKYKKKLKANRAIIGYPGIGWVGYLTAVALIKSCKSELAAGVLSSTLSPPRAEMLDGGLISFTGTNIFYLKDSKTIVVNGSYQPKTPHKHLAVLTKLLVNDYKVKEIIGIGGYYDPSSNNDEIYFYSNNPEVIEKYKNKLKPGVGGGNLIGILAILPAISLNIGNVDGWIMLKTVSDPDIMDLNAMKNTVKKLDEMFDLKVDYSKIDEMIYTFEQIKAQIVKDIKLSEDEATKQYIR